MQIKSKSRILFEGDFATVKKLLEAAILNKVDLSGANLSGANLSGADLSGANLSDANLSGANLSSADLSCANLFDAHLSCANLSCADLSDANLSGADLSYANLSGADLSGAKYRGLVLTRNPIFIGGLRWKVVILNGTHIGIGCEFHSVSDWESFDDSQINFMHPSAVSFWAAYKDILISLARKE